MRSLPQPPGPSTASPSVFSGRSNGTNGNANGTGTPEPKPASGEVRTPANKPSRSRLPYPSGDYTSPDDGFSPSSRPGSPSYDSPSVSMTSSFTMAGTHSQDRSGSDGSYVIPQRVRSPSPPVSNRNSTASTDLAPPKTPVANRASSKSPSPTPRKRYTVALSGREDLPSPNTATRGEGEVQTALFSDSPNGSRTQSPIEAAERFTFGFGGLVNGHGKESSDSTDATAAPPEREQNTSPEPTIGNTAIILSRLSSSPPPTKPGSGSPKPMGRPRSLYSIQSISPSLKTVSSSTTTNTTQTSPRTPSFRARAQSAFQPLDSVSATLHNASTPTTPAPSERRVGRKPVPEEGKKTHRRSQSIGHGLGITTRDLEAEPSEGSPRSAITASSYVTSSSVVTSAVTGTSVTGTSVGVRTQALVTPSGAPFVDPLVIRKKTKDVPPTPVAVKNVPGGKIPFGQLLAFFDGEKQ
ncbi:hypothetical protein FRB99_002359 [Tulasnella sp. 403]|nr:hypothetical protein FRB99_002359 [Tulasnella sp. 403]